VLPNARIKRGPVVAGAIFTTILFMASRFLITYYLGHTSMSSAYGAAGSVIVILLWVYYSSILLYLGAAFTRVYALHRGTPIYPNVYAVSFEEVVLEHHRGQPDSQKIK
jgi:membrane protein